MKFKILIPIFLLIHLIQADPLLSDSIPSTAAITSEEKPYSDAVAYAWALGGGIALPVLGAELVSLGNREGNDVLEKSGATMVLVGLTAGPSAEEFYAGSYSQALWTSATRGVGAIIITSGLAINALNCFCLDCNDGDGETSSVEPKCDENEGLPLIISGSVIFAASEIYSFVDTHYAVQRANEKSKPQHFGFAPELFRSSNGGLKPGVMAWAKF